MIALEAQPETADACEELGHSNHAFLHVIPIFFAAV